MSFSLTKRAPVVNANGVTTQTSTFPSASTSGRLLVLSCGVHDSGNVTLNTPTGWTLALRQSDGIHSAINHVFYRISAGQTSVTVTSPVSASWTQHCYEFSGNHATAPLDAVVGTFSGSLVANLALGPVSASVADCLIFASVACEGSTGFITFANTWTNSFVHITEEADLGPNSDWAIWNAISSRNPSSAGSYSTTESWSGTHTCAGILVSFKPASGPDVTPPSVVSRTVSGATLTINYDEALSTSFVPASSAYTVTVDGVTRAITNVVVSGNTVVLTLASPVVAGQTVLLSYVP